MSLFGITKGTTLEDQVEQYLKAETQGVVMYCALARLAAEQGFVDIAAALGDLAGDEARHAGLYAVLNGHAPQDLLEVLGRFAQLENAAQDKIDAFAQQAHTLGLHQAAAAIAATAEDEVRHGKVLEDLLTAQKENNSN